VLLVQPSQAAQEAPPRGLARERELRQRQAQDLDDVAVGGRPARGAERLVHARAFGVDSGQPAFQDRLDQRIASAEVVVQHALADAGGAVDVAQRHRRDAALAVQTFRGVEDALARLRGRVGPGAWWHGYLLRGRVAGMARSYRSSTSTRSIAPVNG